MGRDGEEEDAEEEEENEDEREERERRERDDNKDDADYNDDEERENNEGKGGDSAAEQTEEQAVEEEGVVDLIENEDGKLVQVMVTAGKTEQELRLEMTERIAALEKELEETKAGVIEIDDAAAERETVWWQAHPEFPSEWQTLERCTINPKMNEEKLDTPVRHFI